MSEGLICIARDVGGIREIWPKGNGFCLPAKSNSSDFAKAMERMLTTPHNELANLRKIFWKSTPSRKFMIENLEFLLSSLNVQTAE